MLFTRFCKNVVRPPLRKFGSQVHLSGDIKSLKHHTLQHNVKRSALHSTQTRNCSDDSQYRVQLPPLTDDPPIVWPTFFRSVKNFLQCKLIIQPRMDNDFTIEEFLDGSKYAMSTVSHALAAENYDSIRNLVSPEALQTARNKINTLSSEQKQLIAVNKDDIYVTFPYEIGIMYDDDRADQKFVEITTVYHSLRGLARMRAEDKEPPINMGMLPEYRNLLFVSNYRFIREYTEGVESSWTINMINHLMSTSVRNVLLFNMS
ncbi:hypothetical protein QAD02_015063 [Eretmocerus hayati]|uniref:Uncharacterized protein n=1 Tax=Eretmocerus hayati TaxID=131215 RepID=A0ACC2P8F4_9HYME|nr:hypothetical protein QAD02_015063 [Eretmocerus hayati]